MREKLGYFGGWKSEIECRDFKGGLGLTLIHPKGSRRFVRNLRIIPDKRGGFSGGFAALGAAHPRSSVISGGLPTLCGATAELNPGWADPRSARGSRPRPVLHGDKRYLRGAVGGASSAPDGACALRLPTPPPLQGLTGIFSPFGGFLNPVQYRPDSREVIVFRDVVSVTLTLLLDFCDDDLI